MAVSVAGLRFPNPVQAQGSAVVVTPSDMPKFIQQALPAAPKPQPVTPAPTPALQPELIGSTGYAQAYGNCVNEPGVNNPHSGNPLDWPVLSETPTIGATALFTWNHTGVVVGIWNNGDLEIRHQNYWGGQHRFPRSMFRGFR